MRKGFSRSLLLAGGFSLAALAPAHAASVIAQIYGVYDAQSSFGNLPTSVLNDPNNPTHAISPSSWGNLYDTPTLFFVNPSSYQITNTQMVLTVTPQVNSGWNTLNNGLTQTINLGTLAANAITQLAWGTGGSLFLYDLPDILYQRVCELIT